MQVILVFLSLRPTPLNAVYDNTWYFVCFNDSRWCSKGRIKNWGCFGQAWTIASDWGEGIYVLSLLYLVALFCLACLWNVLLGTKISYHSYPASTCLNLLTAKMENMFIAVFLLPIRYGHDLLWDYDSALDFLFRLFTTQFWNLHC